VAHIFVAALGASNCYAEARWSEGLVDWIGAHVNALIAATFKLPVNPRYEQQVAGASLDGAGRREQQIGEGVADSADPQLVARVLLIKERDDFGHFAAIFFRKVHPAEHRRHKAPPQRGPSIRKIASN
jgi:hypothetical protein